MGSHEKISGQRTKIKSAANARDQEFSVVGASIGKKEDTGVEAVSATADMVSGDVPLEALGKILVAHSPLVKKQHFIIFSSGEKPPEFSQVEKQKTLAAQEVEKGGSISFARTRTMFSHKVARKQLGQIREKRDPSLFERVILSRPYKNRLGIR